MKKLFLTVALATTLSTVMAQDVREMQRPRHDRTEMMVKEYGLDDNQAAKLKELNEKYADLFRRGPGGPGGFGRPEGRRMRPGGQHFEKAPADGQTQASPQVQRPSREEMEKRMKEMREKMETYNQELKAIMTESQYEAYQKRMEEMRRRRPMPRQ